MTTLRFIDECTASPTVKPKEMTVTRNPGIMRIDNDTVYLDNSPIAHRIEPHGLGDVHWEFGNNHHHRYTRIEVLP